MSDLSSRNLPPAVFCQAELLQQYHWQYALSRNCCSNEISSPYVHRNKNQYPPLFFPSSRITLFLCFYFFIHFYFKRYTFSGSALSPLVLWSLHTSKHMQRYERRPSASQFILLTLIFISFSHLPLLNSLCVHVSVSVFVKERRGKGMWSW